MISYSLWTSRKVGNNFAASKQIKNLVDILLTPKKSKNLAVILLILNELSILKSRPWQEKMSPRAREIYVGTGMYEQRF